MIPALYASVSIVLLGHGGGGQNIFLDACDCNVQKKDSQHLEE